MGLPNIHLLKLSVCLSSLLVLKDLGKQGLCMHAHHWGMNSGRHTWECGLNPVKASLDFGLQLESSRAPLNLLKWELHDLICTEKR